MKKLSDQDLGMLLASADQSLWPAFWNALIEACRETGLAPARLLGPIGTFRFKRPARAAVERLRALECPFDLEHSLWGFEAMLRALRRLAAVAGIEGAEKIEFDVLYT